MIEPRLRAVQRQLLGQSAIPFAKALFERTRQALWTGAPSVHSRALDEVVGPIAAHRCLMHPHPLDADELHRVAARIEDHARSLRTRARTLTAAAAGTQWHSPAATAGRAHMQHGIAQLTTTATRLEHAAAALRAHARAVRRAEAVLGAAGRVVGAVEHGTVGAVDTAARAVGRLL